MGSISFRRGIGIRGRFRKDCIARPHSERARELSEWRSGNRRSWTYHLQELPSGIPSALVLSSENVPNLGSRLAAREKLRHHREGAGRGHDGPGSCDVAKPPHRTPSPQAASRNAADARVRTGSRKRWPEDEGSRGGPRDATSGGWTRHYPGRLRLPAIAAGPHRQDKRGPAERADPHHGTHAAGGKHRSHVGERDGRQPRGRQDGIDRKV